MARMSGSHNISPEQIEIIIKLAKERKSLGEIAKVACVNKSTVYRWLQRLNI